MDKAPAGLSWSPAAVARSVARPDAERDSCLRRRRAEEPELVAKFLDEDAEFRRTRLATNIRQGGARFAIATMVQNQAGHAVSSVTLVGKTSEMKPPAAISRSAGRASR